MDSRHVTNAGRSDTANPPVRVDNVLSQEPFKPFSIRVVQRRSHQRSRNTLGLPGLKLDGNVHA
jgi:hypothetical protein